jgi:L-lactate dehydrogenase complex protein LldG
MTNSATQPGTITGRDAFLANLAKRKTFDAEFTPYQLVNELPKTRLANKTLTELIEVAKVRAAQVFATIIVTTRAELPDIIAAQIAEHGGGQVLIPTDPRFEQFGLKPKGDPLVKWQPGREYREENLANAANANVAVAFADWFLAESCSAVVYSRPGQGRALHFLPQHYLSIVPASVIVPRTTAVAGMLNTPDNPALAEGRTVHFISGPSNSADIELELVVGLHGPLSATYLIVTDA